MHIAGDVSAAYRRVIAGSNDLEATEREIEERLEALASPVRSAEAFNIALSIDPRDTRPLVSDFVETAQPMRRTQLGLCPTPNIP